MVLPSNPSTSTHHQQLRQNMSCLQYLCDLEDVQVLVKTYPNDYIFHEKAGWYTGIYKRPFPPWDGHHGTQYEYLKKKFPSVTVIESQDHHDAMKYSDKIFNIAGSHVAWETLFTKSKSFTMNFSNKTYFAQPRSVLKHGLDFVKFPDAELNFEIQSPKEALLDFEVNKDACKDFVLKEYSVPNMVQAINKILSLR